MDVSRDHTCQACDYNGHWKTVVCKTDRMFHMQIDVRIACDMKREKDTPSKGGNESVKHHSR